MHSAWYGLVLSPWNFHPPRALAKVSAFLECPEPLPMVHISQDSQQGHHPQATRRPHTEWLAGHRPPLGTQKRPILTTLYFLFQPPFSHLPVLFSFVFPSSLSLLLLILFFSSCLVFWEPRDLALLSVTLKEALHPRGIYFAHA